MADFSIKKGTKAELDNTPFVEGQVLLETYDDRLSGYMYLDVNSTKRVLMGSSNEYSQYTISYNGNGATSGSVPTQRKITDGSVTISNNNFVKTGYTFVEWNTSSDGSGTSYHGGDIYSDNADLVLYAIWRNQNEFYIIYNGNGATSGSTQSQIKQLDIPIILRVNGFTKTDYTFKEWNTASDGSGVSYNEEDSYITNADLTLYAIWESTQPVPQDYIVVAFHNNMGNYNTDSPYYFDDTLANGVGMDVGTEITYGKLLAYPCYGAITTNYYVDGGGRSLRTFCFYVSKDPDGVENTDSIHSSNVPYGASFTITNNITGETERWYVSINIYTIEGDYSSVSVPYFDSSNLVSEVDGAEGLRALGSAFLYAIGQDDRGDFDIIGLSDVPFQSIIGENVQKTITYAGHTYYFYNRLNRNYSDYVSYNFSLYSNNTYSLRDDLSRGELAYIIFDGVESGGSVTHVTDQYITGIWNQPIPINHYTPTRSTQINPNTRGSVLPMNNRSVGDSDTPITSIDIQTNNDLIQIYNSKHDEWYDLYPLVAKSSTVNTSDGVKPTFTFNVVDIQYPQKMEIFTDVYGIKPESITYTTVGAGVFNTITITFPEFSTSTYGNIETFTCKVYFYNTRITMPSVLPLNIDYIEVKTLPTKLTYVNGESIDTTGISVHGYDSNNTDLGEISLSFLNYTQTALPHTGITANGIVYSANTLISENDGTRTPVRKANNGDSSFLLAKNSGGTSWGGNWFNIISISDNETNALISLPSSSDVKNFNRTYFNITYYCSQMGSNASYGGATYITNPLNLPTIQDKSLVDPYSGSINDANFKFIIRYMNLLLVGGAVTLTGYRADGKELKCQYGITVT